MRKGAYYLNNNGSRWIVLPKEKIWIKHVLDTNPVTKILIERTPIYFESFGNFACIAYKYKGKICKSLTFGTKEELN